jgi:hypothetical protein
MIGKDEISELKAGPTQFDRRVHLRCVPVAARYTRSVRLGRLGESLWQLIAQYGIRPLSERATEVYRNNVSTAWHCRTNCDKANGTFPIRLDCG